MTKREWPRCTVCRRAVVLADGPVNRLEAALDNRGRAPVLDEWGSRIQAGTGRHADDWADLAIVIDVFLARPQALRPNEVNDLREGLWELKGGRLRLPFFGVDCPGTISSSGQHRHLVLPSAVRQPGDAARSARGTHVFVKGQQRTPRKQIDRAMAIMRKDADQ